MRTLSLASLITLLMLTACSSTTTTRKVTTYNAEGQVVSTETSSETRYPAADRARELGQDVRHGVSDGYEWTKDKAVKGYHWTKEKSVKVYKAVTE